MVAHVRDTLVIKRYTQDIKLLLKILLDHRVETWCVPVILLTLILKWYIYTKKETNRVLFIRYNLTV